MKRRVDVSLKCKPVVRKTFDVWKGLMNANDRRSKNLEPYRLLIPSTVLGLLTAGRW